MTKSDGGILANSYIDLDSSGKGSRCLLSAGQGRVKPWGKAYKHNNTLRFSDQNRSKAYGDVN